MMRCVPLVLLVQMLMLLAFRAEAQWLKGELFTNYYNPHYQNRSASSRIPETVKGPNQFAQGIWLRPDLKTDDGAWRFALSASAQNISESHISGLEEKRTIGKLHEAYAQWTSDGFQISAGRKMTLWGKSDLINPTDYFSGIDQESLNYDPNFTRTAGTGIEVVWRPAVERLVCSERRGRFCRKNTKVTTASDWTFTFIFNPIAAETKLLYGLKRLSSEVRILPTEKPKYSEVAAKVGYSGKLWDMSVSAYKGVDHRPLFFETRQDLSGPPPVLDVEPRYVPVSSVGLDGSATLGSIVLTYETAYTSTENSSAETSLLPPPRLDSVVGLTFEPMNNFYVTAQSVIYVFAKLKKYTDESDPVDRSIGEANSLIARTRTRTEVGNSLNLVYDDPETKFRAEFFIFQLGEPAYGQVQLKTTYRVTNELHASLGAEVYYGDETTTLGSFRDLSSEFIELKYHF